jgi:hypothetical protein
MHRSTLWLLLGSTLTLAAVPAIAQPDKSGPPTATAKSQAALVRARLNETLTKLDADANFAVASKAIDELWDWVALYAETSDASLVREIDQARRMVKLLSALNEDKPARASLYRLLRKSPNLAGALVFTINDRDDQAGALRLLATLRGPGDEKADKQLEKYAQLAAAMCVVHDKPLSRMVNETKVSAPAPIDLWRYFIDANEKGATANKLDAMPAELLVWVVDVTCPLDELKWAQQKYARDRNVGNRYSDVPYDTDHFELGTPKKISSHPYTLENILKYGGICADQAYFSTMVGKAIGVPTAYVVGEAADVGHAWIGFLKGTGKNAEWNFDAGRWDAYQHARGEVWDPQTSQKMADGELALSSEAAEAEFNKRYEAIALTDLSIRIGSWSQALSGGKAAASKPAPVDIAPPDARKARTGATSERVELLEAALHRVPALTEAWDQYAQLARHSSLTGEQRRKMISSLDELCGKRYADFASDVLTSIATGTSNTQDQNALWEQMAKMFRQRPDLAGAARVRQGQMWEKLNEPTKAMACYQEVIDRQLNAGPFALRALAAGERLLESKDKKQAVLQMYDKAFKRLQKPTGMSTQFMRSSNWFRVGSRYAALLDEAGQTSDAQKILGQLGVRQSAGKKK